MSWDAGACEYQSESTPVPPDPIPPTPTLPDVRITLKPGGQLNNVKVSRRKTNQSRTVLLTVNRDTVVIIE